MLIQDKIREFREAVKLLTPVEKVIAVVIAGVAIIIPLPGTFPACIAIIAGYTCKKSNSIIEKND